MPLDAEKQVKVDEARTGLEQVPQKAKDAMRVWWEANMSLGHRTLGKIFLGRKLKGEDRPETED